MESSEEGCETGTGGALSTLTLRLIGTPLTDGCLLLFAVEHRDESVVPCRVRDRYVLTDVERLYDLLYIELSDVVALPRNDSFFDASMFFTLVVGNTGNAQSCINGSGDGDPCCAEVLRRGILRGDRSVQTALAGDFSNESWLPVGIGSGYSLATAVKGLMRGTNGRTRRSAGGDLGGCVCSCSGSATS